MMNCPYTARPCKSGAYCRAFGCDKANSSPVPLPLAEAPVGLLPTDPQERKNAPIYSGVLAYFPLALAEIARISKAGNDQHNPGEPLHWAKHKSTDQADCIARHLIDHGKRDADGQRHSAKLAWRALALLEEELEKEAGLWPTQPEL